MRPNSKPSNRPLDRQARLRELIHFRLQRAGKIPLVFSSRLIKSILEECDKSV